MPRFQGAFGVSSGRIADTGYVATCADSGVEANSPYQHDVVASQIPGYTISSYDDCLLDLFNDESFIEDFEKKTCVFSNSARAAGSPSLIEPYRVERTSLSLDSSSTGTINSPYSEIFDSPSSEPLYSSSSEALDSPGSYAPYSPAPDTLVSPRTPFPSGSGVVPKKSMRAPRTVSTSSSQSSTSCSSSTHSTASFKNSRLKKEKQRDRLKVAEYAAMSPHVRKQRGLQLNKGASQRSRVKTKSDRALKSQVCTAQESDDRTLNASAGGLSDVKSCIIETLLSQGFKQQTIIDVLRAHGKSESLIMSMFPDHEY